MKFLTSTLFLLTIITFSSTGQKYALLDKKMVRPILYSDVVTLQHSHEGYFPVETTRLREFVRQLERISRQLSEKKVKNIDASIPIGTTTIKILMIKFGSEDRMDVTMTTNCSNISVSFHLADAGSSKWRNSFYINTWIKYIKKYY